MTSFFGEVGKKLAERWISVLLVPSLMLAAVVAVAVALGQSAALDGARLVDAAAAGFQAVGALPVTSQILLSGALLLACSGVGMAVEALAGVTQGLWLGSWGWPLRGVRDRLVAHRESRWLAAHTRAITPSGEHPDDDRQRAAAARRNAIALARPSRPTWMGDQLAAVEARLHNQYGADLESWWPRLWLVIDDATRSELRAARAMFDAAARNAGWTLCYLVVAAFWWPAAVIAAAVWVVGWLRGRAAVRTYATLVEAAFDVHKAALARRVDLLPEGQPFTTAVGYDVTDAFRKAT